MCDVFQRWAPLTVGLLSACSLVVDAGDYRSTSSDGGSTDGSSGDGGSGDGGSGDGGSTDGGADGSICEGPSRMICASECVDTATNPEHCGGCDNACPAGATCAGGDCVCATCSDIPAVRALQPTAMPALRDLYITELGEEGGGWVLSWRTDSNRVQAVKVRVTAEPECRAAPLTAAPLSLSFDVGSDTDVEVNYLDVRTNYPPDRSTDPGTFLVLRSPRAISLWSRTDDGDDPDVLSFRSNAEWLNVTSVRGVALAPEVPAPVAYGANRGGGDRYEPGADVPPRVFPGGVALSGEVAVGPYSALVGLEETLGAPARLRRALVETTREGSSVLLTLADGSRAVEHLVAAVNPQRVGGAREHFVMALAGASTLHKLHCTETLSDCDGDTSLSAVPRIASSPIAAYTSPSSGGERVTVFAVELEPGGPSPSLSVVRRTSMTDPRPVLSSAIVGAPITNVLALDAEAVRAGGTVGEGWDFVWAAFVAVQRSGAGPEVELWTGAQRVCASGP